MDIKRWHNTVSSFRQLVSGYVEKDSGSGVASDPPNARKKNEVSTFVNRLFSDSLTWRDGSLQNRVPEDYALSPTDLWEKNRYLETGKHWEVHGNRKTQEDDAKHELVDNETGNQIRAKKSYLTANWHDVTVHPNIKNINDILEQEREATDWGRFIRDVVTQGNTEGTAVAYSFLDRTLHPEGVVREVLLDNESLFPTPYIGETYERIQGCWYLIVATLQESRQMLKEYPGLKASKLTERRSVDTDKVSKKKDGGTGFDETKLVLKLDCWLDDDSYTEADFDQEEFDLKRQLIDETARELLERRDAGEQPEINEAVVEIGDTDHHPKYIEAYANWLEEILGQDLETPQDEDYIAVVGSLIEIQMAAHGQAQEDLKESGVPSGKKQKYPYGRHIVIVSDQVVEDEPNEWEFDWRKLFHKYDHERIPGHHWGRGMPEILYNDQFTINTMLSRIADVSLFVGIPKPWLNILDKDIVESEGYNNDPTIPAYYRGSPPQFPKGTAPQEMANIYSAKKESIKKAQGASDVIFGEAPHSRASGELTEMLLQQASIQITGEAASNLIEFVKSVFETRIMMMRQAYTTARYYRIEGHYQPVVISDLLEYEETQDTLTGEIKQTPIPKIEIKVEPESNYPMRWMRDVSMLLRMAEALGLDNGIPMEMILDIVGERFPSLKEGGKHRQIREIIQLGMQKMQEMQEAQNQEEATLKQVEQRVRQEGIDRMLGDKQIVDPTRR